MCRTLGYLNILEEGIELLKTYDSRVSGIGYAFLRGCAIVLLISMPLLSSCEFLQQAVSEEWKWTKPSPYLRKYEKWTREGRAYTGLSIEMTAQATLMSPEFRKALIEKRSRDFLYSPQERQRLLEAARIESRKVLDFTVFVFTPEAKFSELRLADSVWEIYVENEAGQRLKPAGVEKLPNEYDVLVRDFPRINRWAVPYRIRFEAPHSGSLDFISAPAELVTLCVTGSLGTVRMSWECDWNWPSE